MRQSRRGGRLSGQGGTQEVGTGTDVWTTQRFFFCNLAALFRAFVAKVFEDYSARRDQKFAAMRADRNGNITIAGALQ